MRAATLLRVSKDLTSKALISRGGSSTVGNSGFTRIQFSSFCGTRISSFQGDHHNDNNDFGFDPIPQPLPALAYDYYDGAENDEDSVFPRRIADGSDVTLGRAAKVPPSSNNNSNNTPSNNNNNNNNPANNNISSSTVTSSKRSFSGGGGGGGTGRYRCPKCGTKVTFCHHDFDESSFYCASCSGWFFLTPQAMDGGKDDASFKDFSKPTASFHDPQVLMQHETGLSAGNRRANAGADNSAPPGQASSAATASKSTASSTTPITRLPTPREICDGLNEYVIGQHNVKVALSVGVHNHYKRLRVAERAIRNSNANNNNINGGDAAAAAAAAESANLPSGTIKELNLAQFGKSEQGANQNAANSDGYCEQPDLMVNSIANPPDAAGGVGKMVEDCELDKSNIIIIGPTGSGKTLLVKTLAKLIDVPLVIADATCLTQAGYVGEDVESILFKLYLESGQDLERCQRGIIYLDESDKIRKSGGNVSISRDVSGEGVQHALLKIVEGNVINVPKEPGRKNPRGDFLQINTSNILFICGGAFSGLEHIINRRMDAASIGFGAQMKKQLEDHKVQGKYFDNAIPKDLVQYGMIPEFVGRFPVIVSTKGLDVSDLINILTVPRNSLVKQYRYLFAMNNISLHVTECGLEEVAKTAFSRGTGARGLRSITENVLMETMFVVPSMPDVHTVYLDAAAVRGERKPILLQHPSMTVEKYESLVRQGESEIDGAVPVDLTRDPDEVPPPEPDTEEAA